MFLGIKDFEGAKVAGKTVCSADRCPGRPYDQDGPSQESVCGDLGLVR